MSTQSVEVTAACGTTVALVDHVAQDSFFMYVENNDRGDVSDDRCVRIVGVENARVLARFLNHWINTRETRG